MQNLAVGPRMLCTLRRAASYVLRNTANSKTCFCKPSLRLSTESTAPRDSLIYLAMLVSSRNNQQQEQD